MGSDSRARRAALFWSFSIVLIGLLWVLGNLPVGRIIAQDSTPPSIPTFSGPIFAYRAEPRLMTEGKGGSLTVYGGNFTPNTRIRLIGFGVIDTTVVSNGVLIGKVPEALPQGQYGIEVIDPLGGTALSPDPLVILPAPTTPTPPPSPTPEPTLIPGQPTLVVQNFSASPAKITPGSALTLSFEVVNQGNRTARGVSVALESGAKFFPADGQAAVLLPNIPIGGKAQATLNIVAAVDAPSGPNPIPILFSFLDMEGKAYTSKAFLSVTVEKVVLASQVTLTEYRVNPDPVLPGEPVTLDLTLTNNGNETARQVLLRFTGESGVLLAGAQGNAFPMGDLAAGERRQMRVSMVASSAAKVGAQPQPVTISSVVEDKTQEVATSLTINIARTVVDRPLLLIKSYQLSKEKLSPGDRFTLTLEIENVGTSAADETLLTFGTVDSAPPSTPDGSGGGRSTGGSDNFAPIGSGGSQYIGSIEIGATTRQIVQEFIVNGTINSGIYGLPITLNYIRRSDGAPTQDGLRASVVVVAPPALQVRLQSPLPPNVNGGEPLPLALEIVNTGEKRVNLLEAAVEAQNGMVVEGAKSPLNNLNNGEDTTVNAVVIPLESGALAVTFTIAYIDELRQQSSLRYTFQTEVAEPTPPPEIPTEEPPLTPIAPTPTPTLSQNDLLRRILLGLLGLGS